MKFTSPEKFISEIQEEGRSFDLLSTLLSMEETVIDARKKTIVNIFLQPTHTLTLKNLKKIVNKDFPGESAFFLMKTVWYNEYAISLSKKAFFVLLISTIIFVLLLLLMTFGFERIPFLTLIKIINVIPYSVFSLLFSLIGHLLCYQNVIFRLLKTFDWLKDLMTKSCESTTNSLQRERDSVIRYKEKVKATENEHAISLHILALATDLAKYQYSSYKSTVDYLEFLKFKVDDLADSQEENIDSDDEQSPPAKKVPAKDTIKNQHFFRNDNGRKLEETIVQDEQKYLQFEKGKIKNQHIVDPAAIPMYSIKNILSTIKDIEKELMNAILREDEHSKKRKEIEYYQKDMEMKRRGFAYALSLLESRGEAGLLDVKMAHLIELCGLYKEGDNFFFSPEVVQIIEENRGYVIAKESN